MGNRNKSVTSLAATLITVVAVTMTFSVLALYSTAEAQNLSGRGVDMRALAGRDQACRPAAMKAFQRVIVLRQRINQVLSCNNNGEFFVEGVGCVPAVMLDNRFSPDHTGDPENRDALSFFPVGQTPDEYGIIGGADGEDIRCRVTCTPLTDTRTCIEDGNEVVTEIRFFECPDRRWTGWASTGATCDSPPPPPEPESPEPEPESPEPDPESPEPEPETTCTNPCKPPAQLSVSGRVTVYKSGSWTCDSGGYTSTTLTCQNDGTMSNAPWSYQCDTPSRPTCLTWSTAGNSCGCSTSCTADANCTVGMVGQSCSTEGARCVYNAQPMAECPGTQSCSSGPAEGDNLGFDTGNPGSTANACNKSFLECN